MIDKLQLDLKQAMLARETLKVSVLRWLINSLNTEAKNKKRELTEPEELAVLRKEAKVRTEAAAGFKQGGAGDRAEQELQELAIIQTYLPQPLSDEELDKLVEQAVSEVGKDMKNMGQIISLVVERAAGRADGAQVAAKVREQLQ